MSERTIFQQWRNQNEATHYPFASHVLLTNGVKAISAGVFLDAAIYPIGGQARVRLSKVIVTPAAVTLWIGDQTTDELASTTYPTTDLPDSLMLRDTFGRPAGMFVASPVRLGVFSAWGVGTYVFDADATEFAATVVIPTPEPGVRGVLLDDGTLLTGDVWLLGDDGVVLTRNTVSRTDPDGNEETFVTIRVDIVGDPLFRRRLCSAEDLFASPRYIKSITFLTNANEVIVTPDSRGNVTMTPGNTLAVDNVLRIYPKANGNHFEAVSSPLTAG